ncbi:hypothetical protein BGZ76_008306, partial [Entomortierella beljakovae]
MPNIVYNILNAHLGYNAAGVHVGSTPGHIYIQQSIGFVPQDEVLLNFARPLIKVATNLVDDNRDAACGE